MSRSGPGFRGSRVQGAGGQPVVPVEVVVHAEEAAVPQALQRSDAAPALLRCAALHGEAVALAWAQQILLALLLATSTPDDCRSLLHDEAAFTLAPTA